MLGCFDLVCFVDDFFYVYVYCSKNYFFCMCVVCGDNSMWCVWYYSLVYLLILGIVCWEGKGYWKGKLI